MALMQNPHGLYCGVVQTADVFVRNPGDVWKICMRFVEISTLSIPPPDVVR